MPLPTAPGSFEQRLRRAETLIRIASQVRFDQPLPDVLRSLAENVVAETSAVASGVILMNPSDLSGIAFGACNLPEGYVEAMVRARQGTAQEGYLRDAVANNRTWVLRDAPAYMLGRPEYEPMYHLVRQVPYNTLVATPFLNRPETIGIVYVYYPGDVEVDEDEIAFARAIAERVQPVMDNAWLFSQAERRTAELDALRRADDALHRSLRRQDVLDAMVTLASELLGAGSSMVATPGDDGRLRVEASRGLSQGLLDALDLTYRGMDRRRLAARRPEMTIVEDARTDPRVEPSLRALLPACYAEIPVFVNNDPWAVFSIGWPYPRTFNDDDRRLFQAFASRAGLAVQNALLFAQSQQRTAELEALHRADEALHRSLNLQDVLQAMVDLAFELLGAGSALVVAWDERDRLAIRAAAGIGPNEYARINARYQELSRERFAHWQLPFRVALVEDVNAHPRVRFEPPLPYPNSLAEIPVELGGELWGFFSIGWRQVRTFSDDDRRLFQAFASRASLAIQNALLFERAQAAASMEERQRIARELHDSVSQALYGIGLGARTAMRRLGDAPPSEVAEPIDYVIQLAESGLAETRALIFELVPESLAEQGLVLALQRQAAATRSRFRVEVSAYLCDEPDLPVRAKEALYRIAQESLHNMAKHAQATLASVSLSREAAAVRLVIQDNGKGFDTSEDFPGHLGLRTMQERARRIGGLYSLASTPGQGTTVTVTVPLT